MRSAGRTRQPVPLYGFLVVLRNAKAFLIHVAEIVLRFDVVEIGGVAIPLHGFRIVLRNAVTVLVHDSEIVLGAAEAFVRGQAVPLQRFAVVLRRAAAELVENAKGGLRGGVALGGQRTEQLQRCDVVAALEGGLRIFERTGKSRPCHERDRRRQKYATHCRHAAW